jgi:hypothetical protein
MKLKEPILKVLDKKYEPLTLVELKFSRYDLAIKTDEDGLPILLFMGKKIESGQIVGERYARRLKYDDQGNKIKDHWEHKGKAS